MVADVSHLESAHPFSRAARWFGRGAIYAVLVLLWIITLASPLLVLVALGVWPWALPLIALGYAGAIY